MTVRFWPLTVIPGASFGGWASAFVNQGIVAAGKNNVRAVVDTALRRYAGIAFPAAGNNNLESSLKSNPLVWAVPNVLPVAALAIQDMFVLPGVAPDTLLVATQNSADGRLYKFVLGTGWTVLNFPERTTSDSVNCISPTTNPDVFLIGNQCQAAAGAPAVWKFVLSTVTWTKVAGVGLGGSWAFTQNSGLVGSIRVVGGLAYVIVGGGTANQCGVWRSDSLFTTWTQIGGNGLFGSWAAGTKRNGEIVFASNGKLYAGIGGGTAGSDPEAWECSNPSGVPAWVQIGDSAIWGAGTKTNASTVAAFANKVVFGTSGSVAGDSTTWQFDTSTRTWVQLAAGTWNRTNSGALYVSPFDQKLFAGVGNNTTGTAAVYEAVGAASGVGQAGMFFPAPIKIRA